MFNEIELSEEFYTIDVPVKIYERVRLTGCSFSREDEKHDAGLIIFDFGEKENEISDEILKRHGLKRSKIGIYKYLPVGNQLELWTADVFIPIKINLLKVHFRTWKNKYNISIAENILIEKDYAYSKIYKEFLSYQKQLLEK